MNAQQHARVVGMVMLIFSATAFAQTQIPHVFQAGQPANAQEVNANYSVAEDGINENYTNVAANGANIAANLALIQDNQSAIGASGSRINVLAAGTAIGLYVGRDRSHPAIFEYRGLSSQRYYFNVVVAYRVDEIRDRPPPGAGDLAMHQLWYSEPACAGQAYVKRDFYGTEASNYDLGFVFRSPNPANSIQHHYIPRGSTAEIMDLSLPSYRSFDGACYESCEFCHKSDPTAASGTYIPVFSNDPAVTGIPDTQFAAPISLGR